MRGQLVAALAAGTLLSIAFGGIAMASEGDDLSVPSIAVPATDAPGAPGEGTSDDVSSPDAEADPEGDDQHGLVCVLLPVETVGAAETDEAGEAALADDAPLTADDIACTGTGNERSAEVALVPRYLAHSGELSGAERGLAISAWAKSKSQKQSDDVAEPTAPETETPDSEDVEGDAAGLEPPASPGRSGDAPGHSGSHGNGGGSGRH